MEAVFILVFVMVMIFGFVASSQQSKKTEDAWSRCAREFGLEYVAPSFLQGREIRGEHCGLYVLVDTYSAGGGKKKRRKYYTRFRVSTPGFPAGFKLSQEGFFTGVTKFFGAQDIEIGDADFDDQFLVKGNDPREVREFLTPARRLRLRSFFLNFEGGRLEEGRLHWSTRGIIRDLGWLRNTLRALTDYAIDFCDDGRNETLERAIEQQNQGHTEEAIEILSAVTSVPSARVVPVPVAPNDASASPPPLPPPLPPPIPTAEESPSVANECALQGGLLAMSGRTDEAKKVIDRGLEDEPDHRELKGWSELIETELIETELIETMPSEDVPDEASEPAQAAAEPVAGPVNADELSTALFREQRTSVEVHTHFEKDFKSREVHGSGVLKSLEPYTYDFVFGSGDGCKAVVEIASSELVGDETSCVLQLPANANETLDSRIEQRVEFRGTLARVDGFLKNIFVTDATIQ